MKTLMTNGHDWSEQMYRNFALYNGGLTKKYHKAIYGLKIFQDENIKRIKKQEVKDFFSEIIYPEWRSKSNIGRIFPVAPPDWSKAVNFLWQSENQKTAAIRAWENKAFDKLYKSQKFHALYYRGMVFN